MQQTIENFLNDSIVYFTESGVKTKSLKRDFADMDNEDLKEGEEWIETLKKAIKKYKDIKKLVAEDVWENYKKLGFMEELYNQPYEVKELQKIQKIIRILYATRPNIFKKGYVNYNKKCRIIKTFLNIHGVDYESENNFSGKEEYKFLKSLIDKNSLKKEFKDEQGI